jgi:hypothetical protein
MKVRAVIAGLAILMVVFCLVAPSRAAKSNRHNIDFMPPADEHPWQHGDAPDPGGDSGVSMACRIVVLPVFPGLRVILSMPNVQSMTGSTGKASCETVSQPDNEDFRGAR